MCLFTLAAVLAVAGAHPATANPDLGSASQPPAKSTLGDPLGDTFGSGADRVDLTGFSALRVGHDLVLALSFAEPIRVPGSGGPNALYGFVDLDIDGDSETGGRPFIDFLTPHHSGLGTDLYIPLDSYRPQDGAVDLVTHTGNAVVARVPTSFGLSSLSIRIPEQFLPMSTRAAVVVGTREEVTDGAPNGGFIEAQASTASEAVRLAGDRFAVEIQWRDFRDRTGPASLVTQSPDSALFWFFRPDNWELMVKVINGCANNGHFWVFAAATTNVAFTLSVTDVQTGAVRQYRNPLGTAAPAITDTQAFATCP